MHTEIMRLIAELWARAGAGYPASLPRASPTSTGLPRSVRARLTAHPPAPPRPTPPALQVGVRCSLEQMLEEGFYHADPQ